MLAGSAESTRTPEQPGKFFIVQNEDDVLILEGMINFQVTNEISCDFDQENKCGWVNAEGTDDLWVLSKGAVTPNNTGPAQDVSKSGFFIYVKAEGAREGNVAQLNSPVLNSSLADNKRE